MNDVGQEASVTGRLPREVRTDGRPAPGAGAALYAGPAVAAEAGLHADPPVTGEPRVRVGVATVQWDGGHVGGGPRGGEGPVVVAL